MASPDLKAIVLTIVGAALSVILGQSPLVAGIVLAAGLALMFVAHLSTAPKAALPRPEILDASGQPFRLTKGAQPWLVRYVGIVMIGVVIIAVALRFGNHRWTHNESAEKSMQSPSISSSPPTSPPPMSSPALGRESHSKTDSMAATGREATANENRSPQESTPEEAPMQATPQASTKCFSPIERLEWGQRFQAPEGRMPYAWRLTIWPEGAKQLRFYAGLMDLEYNGPPNDKPVIQSHGNCWNGSGCQDWWITFERNPPEALQLNVYSASGTLPIECVDKINNFTK